MCGRCSYKKLAIDVKVGSQILCADGSIVLEVLETNPKEGTVKCRCCNNASLGCAQHSRQPFWKRMPSCKEKGGGGSPHIHSNAK